MNKNEFQWLTADTAINKNTVHVTRTADILMNKYDSTWL